MLHKHNPECAHCAEHKTNVQKVVIENIIPCQDFVTGIAIIYKQLFLAAQKCSLPNKTWSYRNTISFLIRIRLRVSAFIPISTAKP